MSKQLIDEVEQVLNDVVRPVLYSHGGALTVEHLSTDGVLEVRLTGACAGCPAADQSMKYLVRDELLGAVPGLTDVRLAQNISDELLNQARLLMGRSTHSPSVPHSDGAEVASYERCPGPTRKESHHGLT